MNKIWIISDTHFNHSLLVDIGDRPKDFEKKLAKNLATIPKGDILVHLGDICIGKDAEMHERYIKTIQGTKILVRGNHDKKSNTRYLNNGRDMILDSFTLKAFGKKILFTHIPKPTVGKLNIHGHLHRNLHHLDIKYSPLCQLYSCEFMGYKPVLLESMIDIHNKNKKV